MSLKEYTFIFPPKIELIWLEKSLPHVVEVLYDAENQCCFSKCCLKSNNKTQVQSYSSVVENDDISITSRIVVNQLG